MSDVKIDVKVDALVRAQEMLEMNAIEKKTKILMGHLSKINSIKLDIEQAELKIKEIEINIEKINNKDLSEFMDVNEGERW